MEFMHIVEATRETLIVAIFNVNWCRCYPSWSILIQGGSHRPKSLELLRYNVGKRMYSSASQVNHRSGEEFLWIEEDYKYTEGIDYLLLLKTCREKMDLQKGTKIHVDITKKGLNEKTPSLDSSLANMYVKCGALVESHQVLDTLHVQDVVTWNALIAAYAKQGKGKAAINVFKEMQKKGLVPNTVTFICLLKACGCIRAVEEGQKAHTEILKMDLIGSDVKLGNALVDMYVKCGMLAKAKKVLLELPIRDVVSWNGLISGYALYGQVEEAFQSFQEMKRDGLNPNAVTFICMLRTCGSAGDLDKGVQIHDEILNCKGVVESNIVIGNALVDMYAKCAALSKAQQVLESLPARDVVSWNALITGYTQHGQGKEALQCFSQMQKDDITPNALTYTCILKACSITHDLNMGKKIHDEIVEKGYLAKDIVIATALVDMYGKCGMIAQAEQVHKAMPHRDTISWNALITGYVQLGCGQEALLCFERMEKDMIPPNDVTFNCVLKACISIGAFDKGKDIHSEIFRNRLLRNNAVLGATLVEMYVKFGSVENAMNVIHDLNIRDVVSWTTLITGYVQKGFGEEAMHCFRCMHREGIFPTSITFSSMLKACASSAAIDKGKLIHCNILSNGSLETNREVGTALMDMYAKCGALSEAGRVISEFAILDIVSCNALIAAYAQQGLCEEALCCFQRMESSGFSPNASTFVSLLNACSHAGLVDKGEMYFASMSNKYGVRLDLDHYTCMVDLYGRAGDFEKAITMIKKMPSSGYPPTWSALLGACQKWGHVKLGKWAFDQAVQIDRNSPSAYISMINIYTAAGLVKDAARIESLRVKYCI